MEKEDGGRRKVDRTIDEINTDRREGRRKEIIPHKINRREEEGR